MPAARATRTAKKRSSSRARHSACSSTPRSSACFARSRPSAPRRRARHRGYPLHGGHIVMLVDIDDFRGFNRARQISEDAIQALKREFLRRVAAVVRTSYARALVQGRSDQVVALLPLGSEGGDYQIRPHALGTQIHQAIAEWKPGFTVSVGLSGPAEAPAGS